MVMRRLMPGLMLAGSVVALLWADHRFQSDWGFLALMVLAVGGGIYEFCSLAEEAERKRPPTDQPPIRFPKLFTALSGVVLVVIDWLAYQPWPAGRFVAAHPVSELLMFIVILALVASALARPVPNRLPMLLGCCVALGYVYYLLSFACHLRHETAFSGEAAILFLLCVDKISDTGAYAFGKTLGRTKLAPLVSPKKTVEGLIGGLACGTLCGIAVWRLTPLFGSFPVWQIALIALGIGFFGAVGDLIESLFKRYCGAKDSANIFGELGGVLDLADATILSAPVAYFMFQAAAWANRQ
jgi:CDP-diglyceride synthetase